MSCAVRIKFAVAELELENFRMAVAVAHLFPALCLELHCCYSLSLSSKTTLVATLPGADSVPKCP